MLCGVLFAIVFGAFWARLCWLRLAGLGFCIRGRIGHLHPSQGLPTELPFAPMQASGAQRHDKGSKGRKWRQASMGKSDWSSQKPWSAASASFDSPVEG